MWRTPCRHSSILSTKSIHNALRRLREEHHATGAQVPITRNEMQHIRRLCSKAGNSGGQEFLEAAERMVEVEATISPARAPQPTGRAVGGKKRTSLKSDVDIRNYAKKHPVATKSNALRWFQALKVLSNRPVWGEREFPLVHHMGFSLSHVISHGCPPPFNTCLQIATRCVRASQWQEAIRLYCSLGMYDAAAKMPDHDVSDAKTTIQKYLATCSALASSAVTPHELAQNGCKGPVRHALLEYCLRQGTFGMVSGLVAVDQQLATVRPMSHPVQHAVTRSLEAAVLLKAAEGRIPHSFLPFVRLQLTTPIHSDPSLQQMVLQLCTNKVRKRFSTSTSTPPPPPPPPATQKNMWRLDMPFEAFMEGLRSAGNVMEISELRPLVKYLLHSNHFRDDTAPIIVQLASRACNKDVQSTFRLLAEVAASSERHPPLRNPNLVMCGLLLLGKVHTMEANWMLETFDAIDSSCRAELANMNVAVVARLVLCLAKAHRYDDVVPLVQMVPTKRLLSWSSISDLLEAALLCPGMVQVEVMKHMGDCPRFLKHWDNTRRLQENDWNIRMITTFVESMSGDEGRSFRRLVVSTTGRHVSLLEDGTQHGPVDPFNVLQVSGWEVALRLFRHSPHLYSVPAFKERLLFATSLPCEAQHAIRQDLVQLFPHTSLVAAV